MSKANLQPRAMRSTSTSARLPSKVGVIPTSANMFVTVGRGEVTAGPHGTAAVGLKLKTLCAFPLGRYLHPEARCADKKLDVTLVPVVTQRRL